MARAQHKGVPENLHPPSWAWDFLDAVEGILPTWTASYKIAKETLIRDEALSFRNVGNDFRKELQKAQGTKGARFTRGAFSASFAGEDPQDGLGDALTVEDQDQHRRKGGKA